MVPANAKHMVSKTWYPRHSIHRTGYLNLATECDSLQGAGES